MNVMVVGLGSMGKRRIRLMMQIDQGISIVGVDSKEDRRRETEKKFNIQTFPDIDNALKCKENLTCAVVSTSPLSHAKIINACLKAGLNVFTELNLVSDGYQENMALAKQKGVELFLSSTFLYRDEIRYIQKKTRESKGKFNYCYHIGQYLPDWHPWENYKNFFAGNRLTNGCREIMAIEFPWLIKTFGEIRKVYTSASKISSLEINYPDNYQIITEHAEGTKGILSVDIISRKPVRNLEICGENLYISWNGSPTELEEYNIVSKQSENVNLYNNIDHQEGYSTFVVENAYKNELMAFFDQVRNHTEPIYGFEDDIKTLKLIDDIETLVE